MRIQDDWFQFWLVAGLILNLQLSVARSDGQIILAIFLQNSEKKL